MDATAVVVVECRAMRSLGMLSILVVGVACGPDGPNAGGPDAAVEDAGSDAAADAATDAPTTGCDYTELRDLTNDDVPPATGTPELTGLTFTSRTVVCGTIDSSHFDGDITVDVDGFVVTLAAEADVLVRIHGAGAEALALVGVDLYTGPNLDQFVGSSTFYGDHGVAALHLPAGTYELAAFALDLAAIASPIAYRIEIVADVPTTRCPEVTTGGYVEAGDGATHDGNDVIRLMSGMPPALTASTTDLPEPTQLTIAPATNYRIAGSAAAAMNPDLYEDKDTFAITTGATTNELAVRLGWPGTTANLDYLLFEAGSAEPVLRANTIANQGPELETFSVKPNASYWLLVGAKLGSTVPVSYAASVCGATFSP